MKDLMERTEQEAIYIIENKATVRETAKVFGVSKSTIFLDISERLPKYSKMLDIQVRQVLESNKNLRHLRGGLATKDRWNRKREG